MNSLNVTNDDFKTPLSIDILSKAVTRINGERRELRRDQRAYNIDFTNDNKLEISFKDQNAVSIDIEWVSFNLFILGTIDTGKNDDRPIRQILDLKDAGIDLRITEFPERATHGVHFGGSDDIHTAAVLLRQIPTFGVNWLSYIKSHMNEIDEWLVNFKRDDFLPSPQDEFKYLHPNSKRKSLLLDCLAILFEHSKKEITHIIKNLGGKTLNVNQSELTSMTPNMWRRLIIENCEKEARTFSFINAAFLEGNVKSNVESYLKENNSTFTEESDLLNAVKNISTKELHLTQSRGKHELEHSEERSSIRRRRKFQKVDKTEFFNFHSNLTNPNDQITTKEDTTSKEQINLHAGLTSLETTYLNAHVNTILHSSEPSAEPANARKSNAEAGHISQVRPLIDSKYPSTEVLKIREQELIVPKIPNSLDVSLLDAIKSTKKRAVESIRAKLGIEEDKAEPEGLSDNVKLIEISDKLMRKQPPLKNSSPNAQNTINFKKFKKQQLRRRYKTSSVVELKAVLIHDTVSSENLLPKSDDLKGDLLKVDFGNEMDDIKGFKRHNMDASRIILPDFENHESVNNSFLENRSKISHEESLFVPPDSQTEELSITNSGYRGPEDLKQTSELCINDMTHDNSDDDDKNDEDDELKFTFRKK